MLDHSKAFSGFAVTDLARAREFYGDTLGIEISEDFPEAMPLLGLKLGGGADTLVYEQPSATPASYTILNFPVDDIEAAVDELAGRGVTFDQIPEMGTDGKGIARQEDGPAIAWFKDPSGNVLSVLQM